MKKRGSIFNFDKIASVIITVLVISLIYFLSNEKDCGIDNICFQENLEKCTRAKLQYAQNQNIFEYKITGSTKESCIVNVKILKVNEAVDPESKVLFEGKDMTCQFPKEVTQFSEIAESESTLSYCSGPLKEAIYELIIKRIYGTIAQNLGEIVFQLKDQIE